MITRLSTLFLRTLREDPADAEVPSHKLLVRAGYVRRVAPGIYSWLPLGLRVLRNIGAVVRQEMDAIGGQEIQFPALLPREPYQATGRWTEYGANLFRLHDRKGGDYLLGPTHEELFTLTVKGEFSSYKDYPVILYQVQTKYRDEERPRAGILRGREFLMKDSYSFDLSDEGLTESYRRHREAYIKIFDRLGLDYVIVSAMSGAMGGSASEEFLAESEIGEDTFVRSTESGYAANVEAVTTPAPPELPLDDLPPAQVLHTPGTPTIDTLVAHLNAAGLGRTFSAGDTLKNVMVKTRQPGATDWALLGIGVPGDREVDMKRLAASLAPAEVPPASPIEKPRVYPAEGVRKARVALMTGCAQQVLMPRINEATIRLLTRLGVEVVVSRGAGCCGALNHHMGQHGAAMTLARANIEAWTRETDLDAVVINASGCGTTVKDYGFMFRSEPEPWRSGAEKIAGRLFEGVHEAAISGQPSALRQGSFLLNADR